MVSVFVDVESAEGIIYLIMLEVGVNEATAVDGNKVSSTVYRVNMDDGNMGSIVGMVSGLHHPHTSVVVRRLSESIESPHNCARIRFSPVTEREKCEYSSNIHPPHSLKVRICVDEDAVIARVLLSPCWTCTNVLAAHAANATEIAGGEKPRTR